MLNPSKQQSEQQKIAAATKLIPKLNFINNTLFKDFFPDIKDILTNETPINSGNLSTFNKAILQALQITNKHHDTKDDIASAMQYCHAHFSSYISKFMPDQPYDSIPVAATTAPKIISHAFPRNISSSTLPSNARKNQKTRKPHETQVDKIKKEETHELSDKKYFHALQKSRLVTGLTLETNDEIETYINKTNKNTKPKNPSPLGKI